MANLSEPLYMQIYNQLREDILTLKYPAGSQLPTEKELCDMFHVSRITSKNALNILADDNLIVRVKGKGSFVSYNAKPQHEHTKNKQNVIGLILPAFDDIYGRDILAAVEKCCRENNYLCMFSRSGDNQNTEEQVIEKMVAFGVVGIIIMPMFGAYYNAKILRLILDGFPVITIDRNLRGIPSHFVGTDNIQAAETAMDYLIKCGHRKIGVYSAPIKHTSTLEDRIEGINRSLHKHNLFLEPSLFFTQINSTLSQKNISEELAKDKAALHEHITNNEGMTAAFALGYDIALMLKQTIEAFHLSNLAIVCFDSPKCKFPESYQFTHIKQNQCEIAQKAFELLLSLINCNTNEKIHKINVKASLICVDTHM